MAVDDIEIQFGDGSTGWVQAKERVDASKPEWKRLWDDFSKLRWADTFQQKDKLFLWLGEPSNRQRHLREICLRAHGAASATEWWTALNQEQQEIAESVFDLLPANRQNIDSGFEMFVALHVSLHPYDEVWQDLAPNWLPEVEEMTTSGLLHVLAAKALVGARNRRRYVRSDLESELMQDGILLTSREPGVSEYRRTLKKELGILSVPGTSLSAPIDRAYFWPRLRTSDDGARPTTVEDEFFQESGVSVDPQILPDGPHSRVLIIGGAGFGKSALLRALAHRHSQGPLLPAIVPLVLLVDSGCGILEFLETKLNRDYSVNIDWEEVCASGRAVVLLDGLDELSPNGRNRAISSLDTFSARFPECSWILTVRELAGTAVPWGARPLQVQPLRPEDVERFATGWLTDLGSEMPVQLSRAISANPGLARLARAPLLLALLVHRGLFEGSALPERRVQVFEEYVALFLKPGMHKPTVIQHDEFSLLRCAKRLAFAVLEQDVLTISVGELSALDECRANGCVDALISCGLLRREGSRVGFVLPLLQEYLAGSYLISKSTEELTALARVQFSRPWAQALLFAVEQLQDAGPLASAIHQLPDDAFSMNLKFLGRAIANGARVPDPLKTQIAESLAQVWKTEARNGRETGRIIADAFANELPPTAYAVVASGQNLEQGGAEILVAARDDDLTLKTLEARLQIPIPGHFTDWQSALDRIRETAAAKLIARARKPAGRDPVRVSFWIAYLIGELPLIANVHDPRTLAASDPDLDPLSRLACMVGNPDYPLDADFLVSTWKHYAREEAPYPTPWLNLLLRAIFRHPHAIRVWQECVNCVDHIPLNTKPGAWWLYGMPPAEAYWRSLLSGLCELASPDTALRGLDEVELNKLPSSRKCHLLLCRAFLGDDTAFSTLAESLDVQRRADISCWLRLVERFPPGLVSRGLQQLRDARVADRREIAFSLIFTLSHEVEMRVLSGAAMARARRRHTSAGLGADVLMYWREACTVGDADWFRFGAGALTLGNTQVRASLLAELEKRLSENGPWESALDDSMSEALTAIEEYGAPVPTSLLEQALRKSDRNLSNGARHRLSKTRTDWALTILVDAYNGAESQKRQVQVQPIESLARSLGRRILKNPNGTLRIDHF